MPMDDDAYDLAACGLLTLSSDGRIERCNRVLSTWTGYAREALVGKRFPEILSVGSRLFHQTHWSPLMELQGSVAEVQLELAVADGRKLPALVNGARRPDRRVDVAVFVAADRRKYERELLLARRRAEELFDALRQREDEFRTIAENLPDVLTRYDREGRVTYMSPSVETLLGWKADSFIGNPAGETSLPAEQAEIIAGAVSEALEGRAGTRILSFHRPDGTLAEVEAKFVPERNADGVVTTVLAITRDVTALKRDEKEARERAELAEQLVGIVSHDLRNPLNAIVLGTQLLQQEDLGPNARIVHRIVSAANRATRLTGDLLDFTQARLGNGLGVAPVEVALHALVAEGVEEMRLAWPGRAIEHRREGAGKGRADADRLVQVLTNLVGNAMAYGSADEPVVVTSAVTDDTLEVRVHNGGRPIPESLQATIFEPLRRGDEQVRAGSRSVGLGLYIVRQIAHAHGGRVSVTSGADVGTTFTVSLPRLPPAAGALQPAVST